jgi:hypothetical protein
VAKWGLSRAFLELRGQWEAERQGEAGREIRRTERGPSIPLVQDQVHHIVNERRRVRRRDNTEELHKEVADQSLASLGEGREGEGREAQTVSKRCKLSVWKLVKRNSMGEEMTPLPSRWTTRSMMSLEISWQDRAVSEMEGRRREEGGPACSLQSQSNQHRRYCNKAMSEEHEQGEVRERWREGESTFRISRHSSLCKGKESMAWTSICSTTG